MSATDNFWRDLVSFTWNMQTVEGVKASLTTSPRLCLTWPGADSHDMTGQSGLIDGGLVYR